MFQVMCHMSLVKCQLSFVNNANITETDPPLAAAADLDLDPSTKILRDP